MKPRKSAARLRDELRNEIYRYEDDELVERAWEEFETFHAPPAVLADVEQDLHDAEQQLRGRVVLSREGRGRLRSFVLTKMVKDAAEDS